MPQVPRSSMTDGARRLLFTALTALVAGACDPSTASSQGAQSASRQIDESRTTAIVRATARVAPAVVGAAAPSGGGARSTARTTGRHAATRRTPNVRNGSAKPPLR